MSFEEKIERVVESFPHFLSMYESSNAENVKEYKEKFKKYLDELESKYGAVIKDSNIEKEFKMEGKTREDAGGVNEEAEKQIKKLIKAATEKFPKLKDQKGVVSGYRSYDYQVKNFGSKVQNGRSVDDVQSANTLPGFSQHHTGKAFDIFSTDTDWWKRNSGIKEWVEENAERYGFEVTYTKEDKLRIPEPWHLFYVGGSSDSKDGGGSDDRKQDGEKTGGGSDDKLDKETAEKINKLAEEFKDVSIEFPKKPDPSKGNSSAAIKLLGSLNSKLEDKFEDEVKKDAESGEADSGQDKVQANKIDTSAEEGGQETPFGKLSNVITDIASWLSGKGGESDGEMYTYADSEEEIEQIEIDKKAELSGKISTYIGLNVDDPDIAKRELSNVKPQKYKTSPEVAKMYEPFPNGGINRDNQEEFAKQNLERMKKNETLAGSVKEIETYPLPKYDSLGGDKNFYDSEDYKSICEDLGIGQKDGGSKFFKKMQSMGLGSKISKLDEGAFIIFVRPSLSVKNKYRNSFSDIAFLIYREAGKIKIYPMMSSSTPSPSFMNKSWRNPISAKVGLRGINYQGTFIIKSSILPEFKVDNASEKSKFYGAEILTCNSALSKMVGSLPTVSIESCKIGKYDPPYNPPVSGAKVKPSICPSLPGGGTSQFLDATTSGDLVIQDYSDYQELVKRVSAAGGSVGVIILNG